MPGAFADAGVGLQQRHQHGAVVGVGPGQPHVQRQPVAVAEHVVLAARLTAVGRAGTGGLTLALGAHADRVHGRPGPVQLPVLGQPVEHHPVQLVPHPGSLPAAQPAPAGHPRPAAQLERQRVPRDPSGQYEHDPGQRGPIRHARPTRPPTPRRRWRGDQGFDQRPELVADQSLYTRSPRHAPRRSPAARPRSRSDTPRLTKWLLNVSIVSENIPQPQPLACGREDKTDSLDAPQLSATGDLPPNARHRTLPSMAG